MLDRLNAQRADHGLPALTSDAKLAAAAHTHNVKMADANQLSHQLPGEAGLGARISAAGYRWSSVGENVAWSSNRSQTGVLALQDSMYNETPPDDGHRRNILSSSFTEVGIDVIEDSAHGKVWLVTDFGRP
ncbi:MAG TPA: CAP domain-containing protein [Propionibacteriaceae bacterium]|nr:CAP domain-containing protein [Propionibacteriaceae bacterium]